MLKIVNAKHKHSSAASASPDGQAPGPRRRPSLSERLNLRQTNRQWFRALLWLLTALSAAYFLLSLALIRSHENSLIRLHVSVNRQMQKNADNVLRSIRSQALTIAYDREIQVLSAVRNWSDADRRLAYTYSDNLYNTTRINDTAADIYVYFPEADMVLGSEGVFKAKHYYDLKSMPHDRNYRAWLAAITAGKDGLLMLPEENGEVFSLLIRNRRDEPLRYAVVIEINGERLMSALESPDSDSAVYFDGRLVADSGGPDDPNRWPRDLARERMPADGKTYARRGDTFLIEHPSVFPGVIYLREYHAGEIFNPIKMAFVIIFMTMAVTLLFGSAWSLYAAKKYGRSWNRLLESLGSNDVRDDVDFVRERIAEVQEKYRDSSIDLQNKQILLNSLFLQKILQLGYLTDSELFRQAQRYKVNFTGDLFVLITYRTDLPERDWLHELSPVLNPWAEQLDAEIFTAADGHSVRLLVNFENRGSFDKLKALAEALPAELAGTDPEASSALRLISVSPAVERISALFGRSPEVSEAVYEEVPPAPSAPAAPAFSAEAEKPPAPAPPAESASPDAASAEPPARPPRARKPEAEHTQAAHTGATALKAKAYIDENFDNPLLGLYLISDYAGVSESYLSSVFKQTYGFGITYYINLQRVSKAKRLILETDLTIKEIAEMVGFASDINFIRVFKRIENRTPGALRKEGR